MLEERLTGWWHVIVASQTMTESACCAATSVDAGYIVTARGSQIRNQILQSSHADSAI